MCRLFIAKLLIAVALTSVVVSGLRAKRSIGGDRVVSREDYPYMVHLQGDQKSGISRVMGDPKSTCSGALLSDQWVLTAAHCFGRVAKPSSWHLSVGSLHKMDTRHRILGWFNTFLGWFGAAKKEWVYHRYHASKIVVHPAYLSDGGGSNPENDIALVKLAKKVATDQYNFIDVIKVNENCDVPAMGTDCESVGWGCLKNDGRAAEQLHSLDLTISACTADWGNILCAHSPGKAICSGDSGGPLVCKDPSDGVLKAIGVASFTMSENSTDHPSAFVKTCEHAEWIEAHMMLP